MKKFKRFSQLITLIAMLAVMFSCVDDDFDAPDIPEIPVGDTYTIQEIKTLFDDNKTFMAAPATDAYEFTADASIYGTVTMDNETDNSYRTFYIQDATAGIAVFQNVGGGAYIGDSVRIYLKDLIVMQYSGLYQINSNIGDGVNIEKNLIKQAANKPRTPELATIEQINDDKAYYQGRLVKIEDVQFVDTDTSKTYADYANLETVEVLLQDSLDNQIIIRTSGYATFAGANVANGRGSMVAIVGQYNDVMQLTIRRLSEIEMEGTRFDATGGGGGGGTGEGSGTFDDPYNVAYGVSNNSGDNVWVEGYIVGVYETVDAGGNTLAEFVPSFTAPFYTDANMIIADNQDETNIANCVIVQLTSGEIRNTLNVVDNASNKGKQVKVYGDLTAYFGDEGLKNTAGYWLDGSGINPDDPINVVVLGTSAIVASLNESFTGVSENIDYVGAGWLNANVQGERYWQGKSYDGNGYLQSTAYGATSENLEGWIVTPGVDLSTAKKLSFDTKTGYYQHAGLSVHVSTDFDGNNSNLLTSTWTEVSATIATGPNDGYGEWTDSGDIDLSAYSGTIYVLFKYVGDNSSNTTTFQLDNVKIIDL